MEADEVAATLDEPIARELLSSAIPARLAYTGLDGDPRAIPIGFWWTGSEVLMWTLPGSAKVPALARNPRVALTIDTEGFPPHVLLVRGAASLELVDGVPDDYVAAARKLMAPEDLAAWEASVRALYHQMTQITIRPDHAVLLDFETTIPKAVGDLVAAHGDQR